MFQQYRGYSVLLQKYHECNHLCDYAVCCLRSHVPNPIIYILFVYNISDRNVQRIFSLNPHDDILIFSGENDNAECISQLLNCIIFWQAETMFDLLDQVFSTPPPPYGSAGWKYRAQWQLDSTIKMIDWTKPSPKCDECEVSAK